MRVWVVLLARRDVGRGTVRGGEGKVTRISNLPIDKRDNEDSRRECVSERGSSWLWKKRKKKRVEEVSGGRERESWWWGVGLTSVVVLLMLP